MNNTHDFGFDKPATDMWIGLGEFAARMGIIIPKENKKIAPPLELVYSEFVDTSTSIDGHYVFSSIKVNGHKNRCLALGNKWNQEFEVDTNLDPILVVDIAPKAEKGSSIIEKQKRNKTRPFCVELTDVPVSGVKFPDVVINYQIGANEHSSIYKERFGRQAEFLLGEDYFFFNDDELYCDGFAESDRPNIIVIPNGNKAGFFKQFNMVDAYEIVKRSDGGSLNLINDLERYTLADFLDLSSIVVTTPSITAMECLAVGLPVLLVKTSPDQTGKFVERGLASWYKPEVLAMLIENKTVRKAMAEIGRETIKNNGRKVVNIIYQEWLKKGNKNG